MDNQSIQHSRWNCTYHIVFIPKYRKKVLYGANKKDLQEIIPKLCEMKKVELIEGKVCKDHIHMCLKIPPKFSISSIVGFLKGKSSLLIHERHGNLKHKYSNRSFWCRVYYVDTVGKNAKKITEYIQNQLKEDQISDKIVLKEHYNPFTGR